MLYEIETGKDLFLNKSRCNKYKAIIYKKHLRIFPPYKNFSSCIPVIFQKNCLNYKIVTEIEDVSILERIENKIDDFGPLIIESSCNIFTEGLYHFIEEVEIEKSNFLKLLNTIKNKIIYIKKDSIQLKKANNLLLKSEIPYFNKCNCFRRYFESIVINYILKN